jgi:hypothetical protein
VHVKERPGEEGKQDVLGKVYVLYLTGYWLWLTK